MTWDHPWQGDDYVATSVMAIPAHDVNLFMNIVVGMSISYILNGFGKQQDCSSKWISLDWVFDNTGYNDDSMVGEYRPRLSVWLDSVKSMWT